MSIDDRTSRLNLPLPNQDNFLEEDVQRLRDALSDLDAKVATVDDNGKVPVEQLPDIAVTDTFEVSNEAAMLALAAQPGDFAIRNDLSLTFILKAEPASDINNWQELINDALEQLGKPDGYEKVGGLVENFATLDAINDFSGELTASPAETPVPSHSDPDLGPSLNAQAQALLDRHEKLKNDLLANPIEDRGTVLGLRNIVTVSDFGGKPGFANDSSVALVAFVNHINSGISDGATFLVDGLYKTTIDLPAITRPVHLTGITAAKSAILFSGRDKGLLFDFRALSGALNPGTVFSKIAILTDKVAAGSAIQLRAETLGNTRMVRFWGSDFQIDSLTRFLANAGRSSYEWKCGIEIGDAADSKGFHSVRLENFNIYGADNNDLYANLTAHNSCGIVGYGTSGVFIRGAKIYLLSDAGVRINNQSEGWIVSESEIVATRIGVHQATPVNPSNNHSIVQTHISPYERAIKIDGAATDSATPLDNYISKVFILERESEVVKSGGFIGVECMGKLSSITDTWVYSGPNSPNNSIAFVLGRGGNVLSNCFARRQTYAIKVVDHPWSTNLVPMINGLWSDGIEGRFIHPDTSIIPTGLMADSVDKLGFNSLNWNRPTFACASFSLMDRNSERKMYDFSHGTMSIKSSTPLGTTQINHRNSDSDIDYAQIQFSGGTSGNSLSGRVTIKATAGINFRGNVMPETANAWSCGAASQAWSGGWTQTAFTITSDERAKTAPIEITDDMLDAWSEVDWCQYKYLDRLEVKGDDARWHYGIVAQRAVEAFSRHNLDAHDFGFLCYDEWGDQDEVVGFHEATPDLFDAKGDLVQPARPSYSEVITPARKAGSSYGIRYEEALALEAALQRRERERLEKRIEALEAKLR